MSTLDSSRHSGTSGISGTSEQPENPEHPVHPVHPEQTNSNALPRFFKGTGTKAVLLVHGYTGITREMVYLGERLNQEGYTVSIPRLPGHGTNGVDFHRTGWRDWLQRPADAYLDLKAEYDQVYIAGLSMGGIITLLLARRFKPAKIALAAPAVFVDSKLLPLSEIARIFITKTKNRNADPPECREDEVLFQEYWRWRNYGPLAQFNRLRKKSLRALPEVTADTLIIVSQKDRTVPLKAGKYIEEQIAASKKRLLVLQESGHVVVDGCEREKVADAVVEWFAG